NFSPLFVGDRVNIFRLDSLNFAKHLVVAVRLADTMQTASVNSVIHQKFRAKRHDNLIIGLSPNGKARKVSLFQYFFANLSGRGRGVLSIVSANIPSSKYL